MSVYLVRLAMVVAAWLTFVISAVSCKRAVRNESAEQLDAGKILIEARGKNRAWHFTYPDQSTTISELTVPAGIDVVIRLRSDDYLYVFSCPGLGQKEIAVPDLDYSINFRADEIGEFELEMDPMCGFRLPPDQTMGVLRVISEMDFREWIANRPALE